MDSERLAEILAVLLITLKRGDIVEAGREGVQEEALAGHAGALPLALEHIIGEDYRAGEIIQQVADHVLAGFRHPVAIGHRRRTQHEGIDRLVQREDEPVGNLQRIVRFRAPLVAHIGAAGQQANGQKTGQRSRPTCRETPRPKRHAYCPIFITSGHSYRYLAPLRCCSQRQRRQSCRRCHLSIEDFYQSRTAASNFLL